MIIGNPLTIGGGGGLTPIIYVNSITGSTVTCDGVEGTEVSGTWTFKVSIGTHTIVGQLNGKTQTKTVVVDAVGVYEVEIDYKLWLLNVVDGQLDECEDVTGGWTADNYSVGSGYSLISPTKNADNMVFKGSSAYILCGAGTVNQIDTTGYTKVCMDVTVDKSDGGMGGALFGLNSKNFWTNGRVWFAVVSQSVGIRAIIEHSISTEIYYGIWSDNSSRQITVHKIWLE